MNLLLHLTPTTPYDQWKRDFDAHAETRSQAGLTLFQLWRDVDGTGITALFEANDRKRAQSYVDNLAATDGPVEARFMRTA